MVCTKEKAKEKWCPYVRLIILDNVQITNRAESLYPNDQYWKVNCIGPQCMKWAWKDDNQTVGYCDA